MKTAQRKKRIAVIFAGGSISSYKHSESRSIFSIETKENIEHFFSDIDEYKWSLFSGITKNKYFMELSDWRNIYELIKSKYIHFDGFVVAQETDSLLFGSALFAYMFSQCRKPIIFTASPFPFGSDGICGQGGEKNIEGAIRCAASDIGEVCVYDQGELHRALRAKRQNIMDKSPFFSYQADVLGKEKNGELELFLHREYRDNDHFSFPYLFPTEKCFFFRVFPGQDISWLSDLIVKQLFSIFVIETLGYGALSSSQLEILNRIAETGVKMILLAEHDSKNRLFQMDSDNQYLRESIVLKNMTVWASFAKAHFALQNKKEPDEFWQFMNRSLMGDMVE